VRIRKKTLYESRVAKKEQQDERMNISSNPLASVREGTIEDLAMFNVQCAFSALSQVAGFHRLLCPWWKRGHRRSATKLLVHGFPQSTTV
jgi:hypothetical protein